MTGRTEQAVDRLIATMQQHHEDPLAHPAGSANRINPVMERLGEIEGRLDKTHELLVMLHSEHRIIQRQESEICALIHKRRAEAKRRETDPPGFNGEPLRREDP
jgi:hypothetical protein